MERRKLANKKAKYNKEAGPNDKKNKLNSKKQNNNKNKKQKPKYNSYDLQRLFSIKNHQDEIEEPKNLGLKQLFSDNNIKKPLSFNFQTYLNKKSLEHQKKENNEILQKLAIKELKRINSTENNEILRNLARKEVYRIKTQEINETLNKLLLKKVQELRKQENKKQQQKLNKLKPKGKKSYDLQHLFSIKNPNLISIKTERNILKEDKRKTFGLKKLFQPIIKKVSHFKDIYNKFEIENLSSNNISRYFEIIKAPIENEIKNIFTSSKSFPNNGIKFQLTITVKYHKESTEKA